MTRIGFNSKAVITGDITQIDLSNRRDSGLIHTLEVLQGVAGISFTHFQASDIVRHPLVQSIVEAYERHTKNKQGNL
jgi:phosphate starvation-inducible PhoH-like protein